MKYSYVMVGLVLLAVLPLTGCNNTTGQPDIAGLTQGPKWDDAYKTELETRYHNLPDYIDKNYTNVTGDDARKTVRAQIIKDLIWLDDYYYRKDVNRLYTGDNSISFLGDVTSLALTSAATIAGGAEAKTVLSGVATLVMGVKTSYDADFLHKQTITSIINEMNTLRDTKHTDILNGLDKADSQYSLQDGLADVQTYIEDGTMVSAIVDLEQVTKANADAANVSLTSKLKSMRNSSSSQP
jgi:hypothetical protein